MPELYRSAYQLIEYDPVYSLLKRVLTVKEGTNPWPEHQLEWQKYASLIRNYQPENIFVDATAFNFLIHKEMQEWINRNIVTAFNDIRLKKWAIVIPSQFLHQVAIEQTMNEDPSNTFKTQYFETAHEALEWLKNGN